MAVLCDSSPRPDCPCRAVETEPGAYGHHTSAVQRLSIGNYFTLTHSMPRSPVSTRFQKNSLGGANPLIRKVN